MNVLSSSFTSMQYFLNKLLVRKKLTTEEYCFYYQRTTQKTFQRRFKVAFRLIWCRDGAQRQINVETTFCTSTLKLAKFSNVETPLCISTLNWTTLDNVETTLRIWSFQKKKNKPRFQKQNNIFELQGRCWTQSFLLFFPILRAICKRILVEPQKFLKHRIHWITKSIFKPSHLVKC